MAFEEAEDDAAAAPGAEEVAEGGALDDRGGRGRGGERSRSGEGDFGGDR